MYRRVRDERLEAGESGVAEVRGPVLLQVSDELNTKRKGYSRRTGRNGLSVGERGLRPVDNAIRSSAVRTADRASWTPPAMSPLQPEVAQPPGNITCSRFVADEAV